MEEKLKVTWTPEALSALRNVYDFIALDSIFQAERISTEITLFAASFNLYPLKYQECEYLTTKKRMYRKATYADTYKIIYKILKDEILILDVFHGKRNPTQLRKLRSIKKIK